VICSLSRIDTFFFGLRSAAASLRRVLGLAMVCCLVSFVARAGVRQKLV
jgi:hypothetical protein